MACKGHPIGCYFPNNNLNSSKVIGLRLFENSKKIDLWILQKFPLAEFLVEMFQSLKKMGKSHFLTNLKKCLKPF